MNWRRSASPLHLKAIELQHARAIAFSIERKATYWPTLERYVEPAIALVRLCRGRDECVIALAQIDAMPGARSHH
jgi:hypothetical protein